MTEPAPSRPEDVLPDADDTATFGGIDVRKGTIAAFVVNAKQLTTLDPADPRRPAIRAQLRELGPAVRAVGVLDVFAPRSAEVAALLAESR
ncbi:MAG: hypothetical protein JST91_04770 [Actinobacteria bacterium]|nr:hypothetical protein [Actinomycetota bacterium]